MADTVLIIVYHPACLVPVFGESALCRLARLAASLADQVRLWMTPEIRRAMGPEFHRLPPQISPQVMTTEDMLKAARSLTSVSREEVLVLPAHSVWDRLSLKKTLHCAAGAEVTETRKFVVSVSQVESLLAGWLKDIMPGPGVELLPFVLRGASDALLAEDRLVQHLAAATQGSDGLLARLVDRPLSRAISPPLARRRVPPNAITLVSMSIGFLGAWLLAQVGYGLHLLGALLFLSAVVLDGVDGEVARLTVRESTFGHYLDIITDNLVHVAIFIGMAVGLYRETGHSSHLYALAVMLLGFGLCILAVYQVVGKGERSQEAWSPAAARWVNALNSRDFAYLVLLLALVNRLHWFLWAAAVGTYLFAFGLWLLPRYYHAKSS